MKDKILVPTYLLFGGSTVSNALLLNTECIQLVVQANYINMEFTHLTLANCHVLWYAQTTCRYGTQCGNRY